jgi:prolyl-tRNA editing enzyme YbaK/EbsC (Cys-tRNA(Pro) deacylase)
MRRFEAWLADATTGLAVKEFPEGTRTATDAARAVGCEVGQIVKSLVFVAGGKAVVALVSGANRVDEKRFGAIAGDLGYEVVWAAAGRPDSVFEIEPSRLRELSGATVVDLKGA